MRAILDGRAATELTLPRQLEPFLIAWAEQRGVLAVIPTERKPT